MTTTTTTTSGEQKSRKERRKEERQAKKRKRSGVGSSSHVPPSGQHSNDTTSTTTTTTTRNPTRKRAGATQDGTGPTTTSTQRKSLQKQKTNHPTSTEKKRTTDPPPNGRGVDPYAHLDATTAAALRRDDQEIAALEAQLLERRGSSGQSKSRLHREYAKLEGYGDDFGDFLEDLDNLVRRVVVNNNNGGDDSTQPYATLLRSNDNSEDDGENSMAFNDDDDDSDLDEEEVPMKGPAWDSLDDDDSVLDELEAQDVELNENKSKKAMATSEDIRDNNEREEVDLDDSSTSSDDRGSDAELEADHDQSVTYRPTQGEDIYGNKIEEMGTTAEPKKYVPPHLRNRDKPIDHTEMTPNNNHNNEESLRNITRSLNSALNRLSEDSLIPVAQSLAELYETHPTADVNACLWQNLHNACIDRGHAVMTGLIPVYVAALVGTHLVRGDKAQLGESLMERIVTVLWPELDAARARENDDHPTSERVDDISLVSKQACNQVLILCYLYNFGVVHCSLLYDIIRNMIESFREIDIELLLLILSHCGRTLRSDDPSALKEIVLLVQKTHLEKSSSVSNNKTASSRSEYMVSALQD